MSSSLLTVKFYSPRPRHGLTDRPHLVQRFQAGLEKPLSIVSAPAGFGKSTLLSQWIEYQRQGKMDPQRYTVCWLSLDVADAYPARFWLYFISAIQFSLDFHSQAEGSIPENGELPFAVLVDLLQSDPPPPIQPLLDDLINRINALRQRVVVILDDYHLIQSRMIHEQMVYLIEHQPPNLHLVISTRVDPPLPIARLRARGQVSEIRSIDLRFNETEASRFLSEMLKLDVSEKDVRAIEQSTEGWAAGLQMAALALQAQLNDQLVGKGHTLQAGIDKFIASFSGKHVYVLDYLVDEVFNQQPADVQDFLLKTSVLKQMCAGLCEAVVQGLPDSRGLQPRSAKAILEYIEKSNLFLISLDYAREWFRYHHLFADLLQARLEQASPELKPDLYLRASQWFERNGEIEDAIHYALMSKDWDRSAGLMESHIQTFLERGQLSKVIEWSDRLPKDVSARRPRLSIQQTWVMGFAQHMKEFVPLLENSTRLVAALEDNPSVSSSEKLDETQKLKTELSVLTAYHAIMAGKPVHAFTLAQDGLARVQPDNAWGKSWLLWISGYALRSAGDLPAAAGFFEEALRICTQNEDLWNDMICLTDLAMVSHLRGQLKSAKDLYLRAIELGRSRRAASHGYLNRVEGGLCAVLLARNELEDAVRHGETGLEWSQWWPSANARALTFTSLGRVFLAKGDLARAGDLIFLADQERRQFPLLPINESLVDYSLVRFWLSSGDLSSAGHWIASQLKEEERGLSAGQMFSESMEMKRIAMARVFIAQDQTDQALETLADLVESAHNSGHIHHLIEAKVLQAVAYQIRTDPGVSFKRKLDPDALSCLASSLALAESGGYIRVFLDEGPQIVTLLQALRSRSDAEYSLPYLEKILAAFPVMESASGGKITPHLPERLTAREQEVLQLLAQGLSNREMAEKLVLSEGTIKTHVHNLIGKLGAQSRTHVLARAKELQLL